MRWSTDLPDYGKLEEGVAGSAMLDRIEWSFHLDLARAPILDAVEECGIQARRYGPVLAMVLGALTEETRFNRVLGAAAPRAATGGHLSEALDWVESFGVDARIPVTPDREETAPAEAVLGSRGYSRVARRLRLVRPADPPDFPEPPGIVVAEVEDYADALARIPGEALGIDPLANCFLDCIPLREGWSGYLARDADAGPIAGASLFRHLDVAMLDFAATREGHRRRGAHLALLRRRIADAAPFCHTVCAEVELPAGEERGVPHPAVRNLLRAGFEPLEARSVWGPPERLVMRDEEGDEGEEGWGGGEGPDDPEDPDDGAPSSGGRRALVLQG